MDASGSLFGTTWQGGVPQGFGAVFKVTPPAPGKTAWTETVLYKFKGSPDGDTPYSSLIQDAQGALYGTTSAGGGDGTVFKLTPPTAGKSAWTETVLYSFEKSANGFSPLAGLVMDASGALYGTAYEGGNTKCSFYGCGVVFKLVPPAAGQTTWTENVIHVFRGAPDGGQPIAGVIIDASGAIYGTTNGGGNVNCDAYGCGAVFKLTPPAVGQKHWTETILHAFTDTPDGSYPAGSLILDSSGAVYGTAGGGGSFSNGVVFKLTPPPVGQTKWTETALYNFRGAPDGERPNALLRDAGGTLYGTTVFGGTAGRGNALQTDAAGAGSNEMDQDNSSQLRVQPRWRRSQSGTDHGCERSALWHNPVRRFHRDLWHRLQTGPLADRTHHPSRFRPNRFPLAISSVRYISPAFTHEMRPVLLTGMVQSGARRFCRFGGPNRAWMQVCRLRG